MDETSRSALDVIRLDPAMGWVAAQLVDSFTEGIAESAKERGVAIYSQAMDAEGETTRRERTKREKYETSRPYQEGEKLNLTQYALEQVFVVVPAIQLASSKALSGLGAPSTAIEFLAPDDEERPEGSYSRQGPPSPDEVADLKQRFEAFREKLQK